MVQFNSSNSAESPMFDSQEDKAEVGKGYIMQGLTGHTQNVFYPKKNGKLLHGFKLRFVFWAMNGETDWRDVKRNIR